MKQPVARLECASCGRTEYKMTAKPVGEEIPDSCSRCHGDMIVKERGELPDQLNMVGSLVNKNFYVWDFSMTPQRMEFSVESDDPKESFSNLLGKLDKKGYVAVMRERDEELGLAIRKKPKIEKGRIWVNVVLFLATIGTTFGIAGYLFLYQDFLSAGLFSSSLLLILGSHELGHKITAQEHRIHASLPYFIPAPTIIGTFGAIIKTKSPIPSKEALVEMGANGPVLGFAIALPIALIGLLLSEPTGGEILQTIPPPLIFTILGTLTIGSVSNTLSLHPLAFASLIGFFVTWLNLMPAGQLDGGHVTRGLLSKESHFFLGRMIGFTLILMGFVWILFLFWGFLILFVFGKPHSGALDDVSELSKKQKVLAFGALTIFILCLPIPI